MRRSLITPIIIAAITASMNAPAEAAAAAFAQSGQTAQAHTKRIAFSMRNDSGIAITINVGGTEMVLNAKQTIPLKVSVGTRMVEVTPLPDCPAGTLVGIVDNGLSGNVLILK